MVQSVRSADADLVTYELLIGGKAAPDATIVKHIDVDLALNRLPRARVAIDDGSPAAEDFPQSASSVFVPGQEIEIKLGYHSKNASVFKGVILGQTIRMDAEGGTELVLNCGDKAAKLALARVSAQFHDAKDSDVMAKIITDAGLTSDVAATSAKVAQQVQSASSAWDFILSRAEANGMVVNVAGGKVSIAKPSMDSPTLRAEFGDTIATLNLELDATQQLSAVTADAWAPKDQKKLEAAASEPSVNKQGNLSGKTLSDVLGVSLALQTDAALDQDALRQWADAQMLKSRLARIRGEVGFQGNAGVKPGTLLDLAGLGARFNGAGYVSGVRHTLEAGDWETEATLGLHRDWFADSHRDVTAASAAALKPGVEGLQIAKVLKTHEDPGKEFRIQVNMPLQKDGAEGVWVRLAAPYASEKCGVEFLPEVGDEVVLGFLGGDPDAGVVLGALHSSARPPPITPVEKNSVKAVVTKSQIKMSFDDDKKSFQVETPGGQVVTLSDEGKSITLKDSTGNSVELSESGIKMSSPKDVSITATGKVSIKGTGGVTVESPADVGIKGLNATLNGDVAAKVKGGASAELSAGAEAKVQAAMVMIN
ncbi:type VI secretion system tip protein VgrG [Thalassococcus sp. BH17M4-6]|uniref:type VI secretion system tip protein VgrG n=1 Tax=Thalassococcus sp. BH17M4-6 TaxID=3413148 RepID=UPI003BC8F234